MNTPPGPEDEVHALVVAPPGDVTAAAPSLARGLSHLTALFAHTTRAEQSWQLVWRKEVTDLVAAFAIPGAEALLAIDGNGRPWRIEASVATTAGPAVDTSRLRPLAISPDGSLLALGDDHGIVLRPTSDSGPVRHLRASDRPWLMREGLLSVGRDYARATQAAFSADRHTLLAVYGSARVLAWDTSTGELAAWSDPVGSPPARITALAPAGEADGSIVIGDATDTIACLNVDLHGVRWHRRKLPWPLLRLATAAHGEVVAGLSGDGAVRLWHLVDGAPVTDLCGAEEPATAVCVSPCGRQAFVATRDCRVLVWNEEGTWHRIAIIATRDAIMAVAAPASNDLFIATSHGVERWSPTPRSA
jgi:hypothetical protein